MISKRVGRLTGLFLVAAILFFGHLASAEQELPMSSAGKAALDGERRLSVDGRELVHMHLQSTPLYGNSTDFMYFYITVYFGSHRQPQTLIVDTGSSVAAIPCQQLCQSGGSCGKHINQHYTAKKSETFKYYDCTQVECRCTSENKCRFYQGYAEGSHYEGYIARDSLYFGENFHFGADMF